MGITVVEEKRSRIIVHPPTHPLLSIIYTLGGVIIASLLSYLVATSGLFLAPRYRDEVYLASFLLALSPASSYVNIILKEIDTGVSEQVLTFEYISIYGIPIPIPRVALVRRKVILAVNVGGAVIPIIVSLLFINVSLRAAPQKPVAMAFILSYIVVTIATFLTSRVIPGAGIAVPALVPPLSSALVVSLILGAGIIPGLVAYSAAALGSLTGADILRLFKEIDKLPPGLVSIGGVGVFDGIFLSGALALVFTI